MPRFGPILLEHFQEPRNHGVLPDADAVGIGGLPGQGPCLVLYLRRNGNLIVDAKHQSFGCGVTIAAGSMLTTLIANRSIEECRKITERDLAAALGGVPPDKAHAPSLAVQALQSALGALTSAR